MRKIDKVYNEIIQIVSDKQMSFTTPNLYATGIKHINENYKGDKKLIEGLKDKLKSRMHLEKMHG